MRLRLSKKTPKKRLLQLLEYTKSMTVVYGLHYFENENDRPNQPRVMEDITRFYRRYKLLLYISMWRTRTLVDTMLQRQWFLLLLAV
jgi:hypothetical protein